MPETNRDKASRLHAQRERETERAIDDAMWQAEKQYMNIEDDPYAFHKAVESLPVAVLVHLLAMKTAHELRNS